jgi:hypothetical protein
MSCNLASTGLCDINANEITSDNVYIYSNLIVSGPSNINTVIVNNNTTLLSSLNVSGFTTLGNETNINASLFISGLNILETLKTHSTTLSTLTKFRSDNDHAIVTYNSGNSSTEIHGYGGEIIFDTTQLMCLSKIDHYGKLVVYHEFDTLLPTHIAGYWDVHEKNIIFIKTRLIKYCK